MSDSTKLTLQEENEALKKENEEWRDEHKKIIEAIKEHVKGMFYDEHILPILYPQDSSEEEEEELVKETLDLKKEIEALKKEVLYHTKIRKEQTERISKQKELMEVMIHSASMIHKENEDLKKHLIVAAVIQNR
tara:strand:- start:212 stop:613 length:402 start_codon:yes stop_codon:yes gene_type:complete